MSKQEPQCKLLDEQVKYTLIIRGSLLNINAAERKKSDLKNRNGLIRVTDLTQ